MEKLEEQIREFHPKLVAVWEEEAARDLQIRSEGSECKGRQRDGRASGTCADERVRYSGDCYCGNDRDPSDHGGNPWQERILPLPIKKHW